MTVAELPEVYKCSPGFCMQLRFLLPCLLLHFAASKEGHTVEHSATVAVFPATSKFRGLTQSSMLWLWLFFQTCMVIGRVFASSSEC